MKKKILREIIRKKFDKSEFSLITNLKSGESCIYEKNKLLKKSFRKYVKKINLKINNNESGIINNTDIFVEIYNRPTKVIIVGAVHIAEYLLNFIKHFNFETIVIDPRKSFSSKRVFSNIKVINQWPDKAFSKIETDKNTALISLSHDPKIDDPAIKYALNKNFFYIGALGSKKTHLNRCLRLKKNKFTNKKISKIYSPIGIKLGGKSAQEIALSITAQLISETNNNILTL